MAKTRPVRGATLNAGSGRFGLPEREAESAALRIIVREIVACAVVLPIIEMMSDPDFWNKMIDDKVSSALRQWATNADPNLSHRLELRSATSAFR